MRWVLMLIWSSEENNFIFLFMNQPVVLIPTVWHKVSFGKTRNRLSTLSTINPSTFIWNARGKWHEWSTSGGRTFRVAVPNHDDLSNPVSINTWKPRKWHTNAKGCCQVRVIQSLRMTKHRCGPPRVRWYVTLGEWKPWEVTAHSYFAESKTFKNYILSNIEK